MGRGPPATVLPSGALPLRGIPPQTLRDCVVHTSAAVAASWHIPPKPLRGCVVHTSAAAAASWHTPPQPLRGIYLDSRFVVTWYTPTQPLRGIYLNSRFLVIVVRGTRVFSSASWRMRIAILMCFRRLVAIIALWLPTGCRRILWRTTCRCLRIGA